MHNLVYLLIIDIGPWMRITGYSAAYAKCKETDVAYS